MKSQFINKLWVAMLAISAALFTTSCVEKEEVVPQLPNMKVIECAAGDHNHTFSFTANSNWRLSSDQIWCKFKTSGGDLQDMAGGVGTHTITLIIGNEQIKNQVTVAKITIYMGNNKAIIAEVRRAPDRLYMNIYNITNEPVKSITIGYNGYTPLLIEANFDFKQAECPEWIDIRDGEITGVPGEQTEAWLSIRNNGDRERWPITVDDNVKMVFTDLKGENMFSFPIVYKGMGDENIIIEGPTSNKYGWEVSDDGTVFSQVDELGEVKQFKENLQYNIIAHKNEYGIVYLERIVERGIPRYITTTVSSGDGWMHFDTNSMTLRVDSTENIRHGQVLALPMSTYNLHLSEFENGALLETDNSSGIDLPALHNNFTAYVLAEFTQLGKKEADADTEMHIYHSITVYDIPALKYNDSEVMAKYGVSEAYIAPFVNPIPGKSAGIVINPRMEEWSTANYEAGIASAEVWYKGTLLKMSDKEFYIGEDVEEQLALELTGPKSGFDIGGENIYIVFKVNGEAKKLLVVTPPTK